MGLEPPNTKTLEEKIFSLHNAKEFDEIALRVFHFQYLTNPVYRAWCDAIGRKPETVKAVAQIPFLPIRFFKTKEVKSGAFTPDIIFQSSATTSAERSKHFVKDVQLYRQSFLHCFERFHGKPNNQCILGLLPSYFEKGDSSLVFMVDELIRRSGHPLSGFYLHDYDELAAVLKKLEQGGQKTVLFGVSYALLDFAESFPMPLKTTTVIETGGMKGRKKELTKEALYNTLRAAFSLPEIHAEYGMTEQLSQAYAINGRYKTPPWMKVMVRDETDPLQLTSRSGAINIIDLANLYSCSFIATDDAGRLADNGDFEVLGRLDNTDIRGCSQMIS